MKISRRQLHRLGLATFGAAALGAPRRTRATVSAADRKFLFIFADGGWDYSYCFAPLFDNPVVDSDPDSEPAEAHGLAYVAADSRPSVSAFFEDYGDRAAIINGIEVRSVTHDRCSRILFTGSSSATADDWGSVLAAHASSQLLLPHLVISGPSYTSEYTSEVVRVGSNGQLPELLNGSALDRGITVVSLPSEDIESKVDAFVRERSAAYAAAAGRGREARFAGLYDTVLGQMSSLGSLVGQLTLDSSTVGDQIADALTALQIGAVRCVTIAHKGLYNMRWDSHSANYQQSSHYELLFEVLNQTMEALDSTPGQVGATLADEVTVVVFSEMGRDPRLNSQAGKHHWTYTSAMLVGAGVQGGQVVGAYNDSVTGSPVDLASGEVSSSGTPLVAAHLGATILALGDVDPGDYLGNYEPISAVLR